MRVKTRGLNSKYFRCVCWFLIAVEQTFVMAATYFLRTLGAIA